MAGHSKWANIKHKKAAEDAKRGKIFGRLSREIMVAARQGNPDPDWNPRLRLAIDKAYANNMPKENVERARQNAAPARWSGESYEEARYEGYGPGGVAIMVDCITDNRNRTVAEVRHAFSKHGGNLGTDGSVAFLFSYTGVITYPAGTDEDAVMEAAIEAGADELVHQRRRLHGRPGRSPEQFARRCVTRSIAAGLEPEHAEVTMRPSTDVAVSGEDAEKALKLLDMLDDLDDVQNVYTNANFSEESLAAAG
ncbi:MAG: YebC/PmpR family DNA-binding transcriptional regulator [Halofilum sp. (in: g-proteobacteria)]|nr:YebC/PmpR family DNA-binding transcriptional regulator [Halofilum sp. (in: g-proteobacteria)]